MTAKWTTQATGRMSDGTLRDLLWRLFVDGKNVRPTTQRERAVLLGWLWQGLIQVVHNAAGEACFARTGRQ